MDFQMLPGHGADRVNSDINAEQSVDEVLEAMKTYLKG